MAPHSTVEKFLCFYDYGKEKPIEFRTNLFVQKDTSLLSTIKNIHMSNFLTNLKNKDKKKTKSAELSAKQLSASRSRSILIVQILQYDLFPTNILFDKDYTFKPDKAALVKKFEQKLEPGDLRFSKASSASTAMAVDSMSIF